MSVEIIQYNSVRDEVEQLKKLNSDLAFAYDTPEGNKNARSHVYKLRTKKADVERVRKAAKADAIEYGRKVDAIAAELTGELETMIAVHARPLEEIEKREQEAKAEADRRVAAEKAETERLEREKQEAILATERAKAAKLAEELDNERRRAAQEKAELQRQLEAAQKRETQKPAVETFQNFVLTEDDIDFSDDALIAEVQLTEPEIAAIGQHHTPLEDWPDDDAIEIFDEPINSRTVTAPIPVVAKTPPLEVAVHQISTESRAEDIITVMNAVDVALTAMKDLKASLDQNVIAWIKEHGDLVNGSIRYYVGNPPKTNCISIRRTTETLLEVSGGDMDQLADCMSSEPFKHGTVRKLLEGVGMAEKYDELFVTVRPDKLQEGKLQKTNDQFQKPKRAKEMA